MTNTPLVSIIIPTYNRAHLIGETLDSVLVQTYTNWECIVIDDGSSDNTEAVLHAYCKKEARIQYYKRPKSSIKGASSCRNYGLDKATGLYVIFLDSDDVLLPNCVFNRILKTQEAPNNCFWVFPMMVQNNGKTNLVVIPKCDDYLKAFLSCNIYWQTMCTLWDINFLKTIHGFNSLYPRLNDPEIHIKAMLEAHLDYVVFNDVLHDCVYREVPIVDKNAYALNYFKALQFFIPDICKKLIEHQKSQHIVLLKHYLNHYIKDFEKHTPWKNMMTLFGIFHKNKVISISDYYSRSGKYLLLKLFNVIFKKIKN